MRNIYLLAFLLIAECITGQATFTNMTSALGLSNTRSGAPIGMTDMNNDNKDDIVILDDTGTLIIYFNTGSGFSRYTYGNVGGSSWSMMLGDINNDGHGDIITGGAYNGVKYLQANGDETYSLSLLPGPMIFVQGMGMADVNNDGALDAMSCHDDGPSSIWENDGTGGLSFSGITLIDFNVEPSDEQNSGNYGITWTDYDLDGDIDLYISKCRLGVTSTTDPRRVNQLWKNDGFNNYSFDVTDSSPLFIGAQSWVTEFQDIDNDGDLDVFVGNHDVNSQLFEKDGKKFIDITATSGIVASGGTLIQAAMKDMDNDGFVDLLVSGKYFHNNGDRTFTEMTNPFGSNHTMAIGDVNEDGFLDMIAGYGLGYNSPGFTDDKLWINNRNNNNFLAVNLIGTTSNRSAIGAVIELHGEWGIMVREIRAGEGYGITHSTVQHFGLGEYFEIDELLIKWPSGQESSYADILPNQSITIPETGCQPINVELSSSGKTVLCASESVELSIGSSGTNSVEWSTGSTADMITVSAGGEYNVTVSSPSGCRSVSRTISIVVDPLTCMDPCETNLVLHGTIASENFKAETYISSDALVSNVEFHANTFIKLNKGFEVVANDTFLAEMDGCN